MVENCIRYCQGIASKIHKYCSSENANICAIYFTILIDIGIQYWLAIVKCKLFDTDRILHAILPRYRCEISKYCRLQGINICPKFYTILTDIGIPLALNIGRPLKNENISILVEYCIQYCPDTVMLDSQIL